MSRTITLNQEMDLNFKTKILTEALDEIEHYNMQHQFGKIFICAKIDTLSIQMKNHFQVSVYYLPAEQQIPYTQELLNIDTRDVDKIYEQCEAIFIKYFCNTRQWGAQRYFSKQVANRILL